MISYIFTVVKTGPISQIFLKLTKRSYLSKRFVYFLLEQTHHVMVWVLRLHLMRFVLGSLHTAREPCGGRIRIWGTIPKILHGHMQKSCLIVIRPTWLKHRICRFPHIYNRKCFDSPRWPEIVLKLIYTCMNITRFTWVHNLIKDPTNPCGIVTLNI